MPGSEARRAGLGKVCESLSLESLSMESSAPGFLFSLQGSLKVKRSCFG